MFHLVSFFVRFMRGSRPNIHTRPTPHQNQGCDCCEWEVFHFPSAFNSSPVLPQVIEFYRCASMRYKCPPVRMIKASPSTAGVAMNGCLARTLLAMTSSLRVGRMTVASPSSLNR